MLEGDRKALQDVNDLAEVIPVLLGAGAREAGEVCDGDPQCWCKGRQMVVGGSA